MKLSYDRNGNKILTVESVDLGGKRGFSVQTLVDLPKTHQHNLYERGAEWKAIALCELINYIREHGTKSQKQKLLLA